MSTIDHKIILDIVSRSLYLHERVKDVRYYDDGFIDDRMNHWMKKVGDEFFAQRLTAENLNAEKARDLCHGVMYLKSEFPSWTNVWRKVLTFSYIDMTMFQSSIEGHMTHPQFPAWIRECVLTYVLFACQKIQKGFLKENDSVMKGMVSDLWNKLCQIASSALTEFMFDTSISHNRSISLQFYEKQEQFYITYPVAARLLSECVESWMIHTQQVQKRIYQDFSDYPSKLIAISAGLSDSHADGQTSHKISFENGSYYMYKPHSLKTDIAWESFCEQLYLVTGKKILSVPVIDCGSYGYCQWIAYETPYDIPLFFENCGSLLCIMYLLHTTDMHYENVIASENQLYIIDTETITTSDDMAYITSTSMLNVKMPPSKLLQFLNGDESVKSEDIGGLTSTILAQNLPLRNETAIIASEYSEQVCKGFASMYESLMEHDCSNLERHFDHCKLRYVYRPTRIYSQLLSAMNSAENLKDGFYYSCETERLIKGCGIINFAIYQSERTSLLRQDIPIFYQKANERHLYDHTQMILKDYFKYTISQQNLCTHLNKEDEQKQLAKIKEQLSVS